MFVGFLVLKGQPTFCWEGRGEKGRLSAWDGMGVNQLLYLCITLWGYTLGNDPTCFKKTVSPGMPKWGASASHSVGVILGCNTAPLEVLHTWATCDQARRAKMRLVLSRILAL